MFNTLEHVVKRLEKAATKHELTLIIDPYFLKLHELIWVLFFIHLVTILKLIFFFVTGTEKTNPRVCSLLGFLPACLT